MGKEGAVKIRSWKRNIGDKRWNKEQLEKAKVVPWEPTPGAEADQIYSRFRAVPPANQPINEPTTRDSNPRGIHITKEDIKRYGVTPGCRGCIAANRGEKPRTHIERCRARVEGKVMEDDPDRYHRVLERMSRENIESNTSASNETRNEGGGEKEHHLEHQQVQHILNKIKKGQLISRNSQYRSRQFRTK